MKRPKKTILFFIICASLYLQSLAQSFTPINGVINSAYTAVYQIGTKSVRVSNPAGFGANDTVLLIQMKGASISIIGDENWGNIQDRQNAGNYEFLIVDSLSGDQIVFTRDLLKTYTAADRVQLVEVRSFINARITGELTAPAWDGEKGGILAMIVRKELKFDANINMTGKGFRGAEHVVMASNTCDVSIDFKFSESETDNPAGRKGEGYALYYRDGAIVNSIGADFAKGKGRMINAGGGGNGKYAGGAGGSNFSAQGFGGRPDILCAGYQTTDYQARGGQVLEHEFTVVGVVGARLLLGGSGGSGTGGFGRVGGNGSHAGGMVIILAKKIDGNGKKIISNGADADDVPGGAGGGGAGGTVALYAGEYVNTLTVEINGGEGGSSTGTTSAGSGGGGGGGTLLVKESTAPVLVNLIANGGQEGSPSHGASLGIAGGTINNLKLTLNGFLFQYVDKDTIVCQNILPAKLIGSVPAAGTPPFNYLWESSTDLATWTTIALPPDAIDYQPPTLSTTTYFRRTVTDSHPEPVTDVGLPVKIEVVPKISNNFIFSPPPFTICGGSVPPPFTGSNPGGGDGASYTFQWQQQIFNGSWSDSPGASGLRDYISGVLNDTTYFRRIVSSSVCRDTTLTPHLTVNVHPKIEGNSISPSQEICFNDTPLQLDGLVPTGGISTFSYLWERRTTLGWNTATIPNTGEDYSFSTGLTETTYYRRRVVSGVCTDYSNSLTITVLPLIFGNSIGSDQTICTGTQPLSSLGGGSIGGGDGVGSYSYNWESRFDNSTFNPIAGANNQNYSPSLLTQDTYFRRIVTSGPCMDTSNNVTITVAPRPVEPITANADETFLRFKFSTRLQGSIPSIGTGTWSVEAGKGNFSSPNMENTEVSGLSFGLNKFRWSVSHLNCPVVFGEVDVMVEDIFRPNAFSPNGDGINDSLIFTGLSHSLNNELIIFNRQGNVVFSTKNYQIGNQKLWDGTDNSGNHLRDDTYYYTIIVENKFKYQGFIVLKR